MDVVIAGGTGFCGRVLADYFLKRGDQVTILSRKPNSVSGLINLQWDGKSVGKWADSLHGADCVVNLAGRSVNCRYNVTNRQEILDSRIDSTRAIGQAIADCSSPPPVWLNASSATIYRHAEDRPMDEIAGEIGSGFSVDVCQSWEREFFDAPTPKTRKVAMRSTMVFGAQPGGVWDAFVTPVRWGLAGPMAGGHQWVSWIHAEDFCRSVDWLIANSEMTGPINLASPNPEQNANFLREIRQAFGVPFGVPSPVWLLEIAAFALGTETELLLKSRRVVPTRLLESGFTFAEYARWRDAVETIVKNNSNVTSTALPLPE